MAKQRTSHPFTPGNKRRLRYKVSHRRKFSRPTRGSRRLGEDVNDLSDFEGKKDYDFLINIGRQAATNAVNENKAMNIPITFFKEGWVVRRMPNGTIEKVAQIAPYTGIVRKRKLKKGLCYMLKNPSRAFKLSPLRGENFYDAGAALVVGNDVVGYDAARLALIDDDDTVEAGEHFEEFEPKVGYQFEAFEEMALQFGFTC
jgi:hypothetical protein